MTDKNASTFYGFFPGEETVEKFIDRLESFFVLNKVIDDLEKVKFLLSSIGSRTYGTLRTITRPATPKSLSYENLITAMEGHYKEKNEMAERYLFWKRDQHPNESIMDYLNKLQRLAQTCNFATFLDQSLRDRFVFGLCDEHIQKILIDTRELTFKKACMIAQTINIKTCLANENLSGVEVVEKRAGVLSVTRRHVARSKSSPRSLSKCKLGINGLSNGRHRTDDESIVVKNEPNEETMVVSVSPENHGNFSFEEIICKGYPTEETDLQAEDTSCGKTTATSSITPSSQQNNHTTNQDQEDTALPFSCDLCHKSFGYPSNLARHRAAHSGERRFKCDRCPKSYTQASSLKAHTSCHDGQRRFACDLCDRTFVYRSNLRVHVETHDAARSFPCRLCSNDYKGRRSLRRHLTSHGAEGSKLIEEINERLGKRQRSTSKKQRSEVHVGSRPHACKACGMTFAHLNTLRTHYMAKHTDTRPFVCDICDKGFVLKIKLKNHVKLHANQRNFTCETCGKGFVTNAALKAHLKSHGDRTFACTSCDKWFKTRLALVYHTRTHTGANTKRFTCEFCGRQFVHRVTLRSHAEKSHAIVDGRERRYKCELCDRAFYQNSHLKTHMFVHTKERRFQCTLCDRAFALRGNLVGHMVVHTGERKFGCDRCTKTFTLRRNLKSHVARSHAGECAGSESINKG